MFGWGKGREDGVGGEAGACGGWGGSWLLENPILFVHTLTSYSDFSLSSVSGWGVEWVGSGWGGPEGC